jgi:malic enzyme
VYEGRDDLTRDNYLSEVAVPTHKRTLQEAVEGADVFLGLSVSTHTSTACLGISK